ncbi:GH25 family lysozyme [Priestia aryabhattai]|uniref:GH25 family lysozyme n=1 Tax=Priestia aryabhattai TaxID=412384 RepID=UPI003CA46898
MQDRSKQNVKIIDVSHHNTINNWKKVAEDGVKAVYIKLTEGKSYVDKDAYKNYLGAKNAGLRVGFYCYSHCTNDYKKEVDFFLNKLGEMKPDLPHCLDLEENKGQSKAKVNAFALDWLGYIQKKTAITPILYTGYSFLSNFTSAVAKYPLWVARYREGAKRSVGFDNPGNSKVWSRWAMFQFTDKGRVNDIRGNVDVNEMDLAFFKSIDSGVVLEGDANPPSSYRKGDSGLGVKELQQKLLKLGYDLPKYKDDSHYGDETVSAVIEFQKKNRLTVDGIAGESTLGKVDDLIEELEKTKAEGLPKVTSLGERYSIQVKAKKDIGIYRYANLSKNDRSLKKGTVFSVYGYTYAAWAVTGGFIQMKDVDPVPVTLKTGGLNKDMETEFRIFLKFEKIKADLNLNETGNPSATITISGLELVKVKQFLDEKGWYYK